jgi:hypothetical protein
MCAYGLASLLSNDILQAWACYRTCALESASLLPMAQHIINTLPHLLDLSSGAYRQQLVDGWIQQCKSRNIPVTSDCNLRGTLASPVEVGVA